LIQVSNVIGYALKLFWNCVYLDDLEPDSGNITDGVTLATESGDKDFVVLFDEVETTVVRDEGRDLLAVLDQLDTHALADSGVRLLGFDTDLKEVNKIMIMIN
jgi:hypothetical protein